MDYGRGLNDRLSLCLDKFSIFVEKENGTPLEQFSSHRYVVEYENYKTILRLDARDKLLYWQWESESFGSGLILENLIGAIEIDENNFFRWREKRVGLKGIAHRRLVELRGGSDDLAEFEKKTYLFFKDECSHKHYFDYLVETIGRKYSLLAYIFFLKDSEKYLPISTTNFDRLFIDLDVPITTNRNCSWENYQEFLGFIAHVREFLGTKGRGEISLLDAHSFCWILTKQMRKKAEELPFLKGAMGAGTGENRISTTTARIGQDRFRKHLIALWGEKCSISDYDNLKFLTACHIKPWNDSTSEEKGDPDNGLLLTPCYHELFDKGYISFDDDGGIVLSKKLMTDDVDSLSIDKSAKLRQELTIDQKRYLEFHRENIYKS